MEDLDPIEAASGEFELAIQLAISRLSPKLRAIVALRYGEGLSCEEVADVLGVSPGAVRSRLARAHEALDRELTPILDRYRPL